MVAKKAYQYIAELGRLEEKPDSAFDEISNDVPNNKRRCFQDIL